ncbi:3 beta-hydroxysteroid dehydrogenase/Delta 5--_4-isomerase type 2 [Lutzomyia longipalpis]|uniref:3 beta-hydroxysteroid dehydrogenase/Delta 5-->4-isomerase type 2 n=1 Tax=Lutzomyia longipalpis TaxID=7200 RepID=UPI002483533F|nr:3 beta-hydroxysteroid dehydrogenase/Delta 5-->4-isomerase type 2 [Lutzomyia longipalpis]
MTVKKKSSEIVLIVGGSGFLGQHIVKMLTEDDDTVAEIRVVDVKPYENKLNHSASKKITTYIGDIGEVDMKWEMAFEGVDCVFHCAAYINFQYPPNVTELERVNVDGTRNVVNLCVKYRVPRLVFTSTSAVTLVPYMGSTFAVILNQTEGKARVPDDESEFIIPGYIASKLRAEKIVLDANETPLRDSNDVLRTLSLRPTLMYGECDERFFPLLMRIGARFGGQIPRIAGVGGKQQLTYVGNAAWAHICAKKALGDAFACQKVSGLPIFITDDSPIEDTVRFCQRMSKSLTPEAKLKPTWWSIPGFMTYFFAWLLEFFTICILKPLFGVSLPFPPRGLVAYSSSIMMYCRLRASIHLDYEPPFNEAQSIQNSAVWYEKYRREVIFGGQKGSAK